MSLLKTKSMYTTIAFIFLACAVPVSFSPIQRGIVETPGLTIQAMDGLFIIKSQTLFETPFNCAGLILHGNVSKDFMAALKHGAKTIIVIQEGKSDTLFGVLYFAPIPSNLKGENVSKHRIIVSDKTLQDARDGLIAYSGTYYEYDFRFQDETISSAFSWVIWLSNKPFWL